MISDVEILNNDNSYQISVGVAIPSTRRLPQAVHETILTSPDFIFNFTRSQAVLFLLYTVSQWLSVAPPTTWGKSKTASAAFPRTQSNFE